MIRGLAIALFGALLLQDASDAAGDKARLHESLAASAEAAGEQLIKLKAWDEARAFLELIRAKSNARADALDKLIAKTEKQTSGLKWDAKSSELIKSFGDEQAKPFFVYALAWKEKDAEASRWTEAEAEILADLLDYVKAYARLTQVRTHHVLPKCTFDWKLSAPTIWHARYDLANPRDSVEIEGKPEFTTEGKRAGLNSIVSPKESVSELLEGLIHAPYYRNYVLTPRLTRIGMGQSQLRRTVSVIDVKSGLRQSSPSKLLILSPPDNATQVATCGYDDHVQMVNGKSMRELGYPISLMFFEPTIEVSEVKATVTERLKGIECYISTPEHPIAPKNTPNLKSTIVLVPKLPLKPDSEYSISVRYQTNGEPQVSEWNFRTAR